VDWIDGIGDGWGGNDKISSICPTKWLLEAADRGNGVYEQGLIKCAHGFTLEWRLISMIRGKITDSDLLILREAHQEYLIIRGKYKSRV